MSYGYSPLMGFDSGSETGDSRADAWLERQRRIAAAEEQRARLEERARLAGRTAEEQFAFAGERAKQALEASVKVALDKQAEIRTMNQAKGLVHGNASSYLAACAWNQQGIPGASFGSNEDALKQAARAADSVKDWADRGEGLDGLVFQGQDEGYVLVFFRCSRRLAACRL